MEEREPKILRQFTAMEVDPSGQLKSSQIQGVLLPEKSRTTIWNTEGPPYSTHAVLFHIEADRSLGYLQRPWRGWGCRPLRRQLEQ